MRVYELKDKFRYLFHQNQEGRKVKKSVSACIKEKFNGFNIAAPTLSKKEKKDLFPINIIYKPVRSREEIVECFFSTDIRLAYRGFFIRGEKSGSCHPWECYYCASYFDRQATFERHIKYCAGKPGVVYDFNTQNLVTFEDNLKYKGDLSLCVYTAPTDDCQSTENRSMYATQSLIVLFLPGIQN